MNTSPVFFFPQSWNAQDLANAVPLRLSELLDFDAQRDGADMASANHVSPSQRNARRPGYLPKVGFHSGFRIR